VSSVDSGKSEFEAIDRRRQGQFIVDWNHVKAARGAKGSHGKCDVDRFERNKDLTIENWILQMETYFRAAKVDSDSWVGLMVSKIDARNFEEIKPFIKLKYHRFREKLLEIFGEPDTVHASLQELSRTVQERDKEISTFMNWIRLLVLKAHRDLNHTQRERILVTCFVRGLFNKSLSTYLATVNPATAAKAERIAGTGDAIHKARRSAGAYVATDQASYSGSQEKNFFEEEEDYWEWEKEECEELTAAIGDN